MARRTGPFRGRTPGWGWAPRRVPPSGWGGWDRHFPTPSWSPEMMGGGAGSLLVTPGPRASHPGGQELSAHRHSRLSHPADPGRGRRRSTRLCAASWARPLVGQGWSLGQGCSELTEWGSLVQGQRPDPRTQASVWVPACRRGAWRRDLIPRQPQLFRPTEQSW